MFTAVKPKVALVISILVNIALAGVVYHFATSRTPEQSSASPAPASITAATARETRTAPAAVTIVTNQSGQSFGWQMVESADYRRYIANLRAIGCPEETIRDIITADVNKLFESRRKEITASTNKFEFWKAGNPFEAAIMDPDRIEKMQALAKEKRALLKELLGVEPEEKAELFGGINPFESMLDFLSPAKQNDVMDIFMKFQAKQAKLFSGGQPDAEDMKAMQKMKKEMDAEMAGILSPKEYEDFQLRMSDTAMQMRMQLASLDPYEQEFRDIFKIKKQFDDQFGTYGMASTDKAEREKYQAAQKDMNDQLKTLLGDARYTDYTRAQDYQYQNLYRITQKNDLPKEAANKVYDMKTTADAEARKVRADSSLSADQRKAALQGIRTETENSMQAVLGDKAWSSFQKQNGSYFLNNISPTPRTATPVETP
jgi:hypothetical protein